MAFTVQTTVLGPIETNCYILTSDSLPGHALLIDPASDSERIIEALKRSGLTLDAILLTHTHFDHMEALDELKNQTKALFCCPLKDQNGLTDPILNCSNSMSNYPLKIASAPDRLLKEGDTVVFGKEKLTVLETPGHTPGSVCYDSGTLLFSGDTIFADGYGRSDLPGGDFQTLFSSVKRIIRLGARKVYPGHGASVSLPVGRK